MRDDLQSVARPALFISYDRDRDLLVALEYGRTEDGQPPDSWRPLGGSSGVIVARHVERCGRRVRHVGFAVAGASRLDLDDPALAAAWRGPRYDAPQLALRDASCGEIATAALAATDLERPSFDRYALDAAYAHLWEEEHEQALFHAELALQAGNAEAHFAIGRALLELGREDEAYARLRHYTDIAPHDAWNQRWLGVAAEAIGNLAEARGAYERALALAGPEDETLDAAELLAELDARRAEADGRR